MDISTLSLAELRRLQTKVETEIRRRSDTAKKDLLKRMQKLAAEHGMSLTDVIGGQEAIEKAAPAPKKAAAKPAAKKAAKPASVIKFRHPENAAIGWTGHGRKPQWVIDWLAQGKALDDLRATSAEA
ncbi:H-NS histone family protein [uncultured Zoogloea sp.]|jgi:DNA-binding protein H-NS|uniref:H-NS histone family protein n=1 Tax=uncultured Zoogloea sp. TaxID=160237 RepID=UPI00262042B3|nr:H-NS histone family protein [uncultured Zoogloea sp.]